MPRVPVLEQQQAQAAGIPNAYAPTNLVTGGEQLAQGVERAGQGIQQLGAGIEEAKNKATEVAVTNALSATQDGIATELNDRDKGILLGQGEDAVVRADGYTQRLSKMQADIAQKLLTNDEQRRLYAQHSQHLLMDAHRQVEMHVGQQMHVAAEAGLQGATTKAMNAVATNPLDDETAATQAALLEDRYRKLGRSAEWAEGQTIKMRADMASTRLDALIHGEDYASATRVLNTSRKDLGPDAAKYDGMVRKLGDRVWGKTEALAMVKASTRRSGELDMGALNAKLQKAAEKTDDPQKLEALHQNIQLFSAPLHAAWQQKLTDAFNSAFTIAQRTKSLATVPIPTLDFLRQHDPPKYESLERYVKGSDTGPETPDQLRAYAQLKTDMADHKEDWATVAPDKMLDVWGTKLSARHREDAVNLLASIHSEAAKPEKDLHLPVIAERTVLEIGRRQGAFPDKQNDISKWADEQQVRNFADVVQHVKDQERSYIREKKAQPPLQKYEEWANERLMKVKVERPILWDKTVTRAEAETSPTLQGRQVTPQFTDVQVQDARSSLQRAGARVDDAAVDAYLRRKHGFTAAAIQGQTPEPIAAAPAPATPPPVEETPSQRYLRIRRQLTGGQ